MGSSALALILVIVFVSALVIDHARPLPTITLYDGTKIIVPSVRMTTEDCIEQVVQKAIEKDEVLKPV